MNSRTANAIIEAAASTAPASLGPRRTTNTHEFYRYPARFLPELARAIIAAFSAPGDVILDPFVGGGTTLVEARLSGRIAIGNDVNQLATFVSSVKSRIHARTTLAEVESWTDSMLGQINIGTSMTSDDDWVEKGYLRHFEGPELWRLRKFIALTKMTVKQIQTRHARDLVKCALLRTAQWALDMREFTPSISEFREALERNLRGMVTAAQDYARAVRRVERFTDTGSLRRTVVITGRAQELPLDPRVARYASPRLVLTSPPYPGVYINYHRWKLYGRKETPLPYWIAEKLDGKGLSYYTMRARVRNDLASYFRELGEAFSAIVSLCDAETTIAQVVGFSDRQRQLPRYLRTMQDAGLREVTFERCATGKDGRLWRHVPGRRWWAKGTIEDTAREVVLFHRLR
jgi:hypothetical protein